MNRRWNWALPLVLLVIGAMFLAACGGDDDDAAGDDGGATATATAEGDPTGTADAGEPTATEGAGPTDAPDGGGSVDASETCSLLTQDEVEAAFGVSMLDPVYQSLGEFPIGGGATASVGSCAFVAEAGTESLAFEVYSGPEAGIQSMIDLACDNKDAVSLGDQACWYNEAQEQVQMKAGAYFVDMYATTSADSAAILTDLAGKVAGRLS